MFRFDRRRTGGVLLAVGFLVIGCDTVEVESEYPQSFNLGTDLPEEGRAVQITAIPPNGEGLPDGQGSYAAGEEIYREKCAACHGVDLRGTVAGLPLIGGRGSLATTAPVKTVESFWPSAPAVFSYIRNTMPTTAPGSLSDNEVYSLMAFILGKGEITSREIMLSRDNLPQIEMPNRDGFIPDPRPDVYRIVK